MITTARSELNLTEQDPSVCSLRQYIMGNPKTAQSCGACKNGLASHVSSEAAVSREHIYPIRRVFTALIGNFRGVERENRIRGVLGRGYQHDVAPVWYQLL